MMEKLRGAIIQNACTAGIGILLFSIAFIGFKAGVRLGMLASKGQSPPRVDPVGTVLRAAESVKNAGKMDPLTEHYNKMINYNGDPPPATNTQPKG
jgi:hypothetical protein